MYSLKKTLFFFTLCFIVACVDPAPENNNSQDSGSNTSDTETPINATDSETVPSESTTTKTNLKDCEITDKHFDKNVFHATDEAQLICIVANEKSKDKDLGDSHRILEVLNTTDCNKILEITLPVNRSPDFPYYLAPETYEFKNQVIGIQGFSSTYYYHVKNKKLIGPIVPQFLTDREAVDAQSGMVKGLTIWNHYLFGHSVDFGTFAFDISDVANPKPILPVMEYTIPKTEEFNNLFIVDAGEEKFQAILPTTDFNAGGTTFDLGKMFTQPIKIDPKVARNVRNNRFLVLNDNTDATQQKKIAIDMLSKRRVQLPDDVALENTGAVLEWLKNQ